MPGKDHSVHNEQACDLLLQSGKFNDWVVTTAFYSVIHLVDHQIFPLELGKQEYNSFNVYCNKVGYGETPHKIRKQLVAGQLPSCVNEFNWLHDACRGARYNDYKVSASIAQQAKKSLEKIKSVCTKEEIS